MSDKQLSVFIAGKQAGVLTQDVNSALSFRYLRDYRGVPLSYAMPLSTRTYNDKIVKPYLWGLLPENPAVRASVAARADVSPNNPFALLGIIGLDCPGAVQFCSSNSEITRKEQLTPISNTQIAHRLSSDKSHQPAWITKNEHWSLGGAQNKFALRKQNNKWFSCEGNAATTHIFKSGVLGLSHQALNEYVCMKLAALCKIPTANVEYREFKYENKNSTESNTEPAIIIERYDRLTDGTNVTRLHQEDICQALSCPPENKYTMYGGPTSADILKLLLQTGSKAQSNVAHFLQMLFFNYLLAATDAHAKNYSLILKANGDHVLAPFYDVASIVPYVGSAEFEKKPPKLAMSIGSENRAGCISLNNLRKMVKQCHLEQVGITADGCANLICTYAKMIPKHLAKVFDSLENSEITSSANELREHMESPIVKLCKKAQAHL